MRYRVRGPLHTDSAHIATELRGFIAHTGQIRLAYLQMHGVAAHTIDVSHTGSDFFEETVLPKIGASGSFIEQRTALRQPKELKLTATLCPTTATTLPNLSEWAGVWAEVIYGPRRVMVRLRCLPEDAERLHDLADKGWRVLDGPKALLSPLFNLFKLAPFVPQFWPSRAGCAASPASPVISSELTLTPATSSPTPLDDEGTPVASSSITAAELLVAADQPNLLLGVTPKGQGVRLSWRAMIVAVPEAEERQEALVAAMLFKAISQGMGALVIAERAKVSPRALGSLAKRLRLIDMADPWESARIPWRTLPPEALKLILGGSLPTPMPATLVEALAAAGRRNLATPVLEALTKDPPYDLAGTLEAGGGVVLLVEPGATASLIASLLVLNLGLAVLTRPLMIVRPASLPMPPSLTERAVQVVLGDLPTATMRLHAGSDSWVLTFPDGQKIVLQENLAAPVVDQASADQEALIAVLAGAVVAPLVPAGEGAGLDWPEELEEPDEEAETPAGEGAGLDWPEELEADEELPPVDEGLMLQEALEPVEEAPADESTGLGWPEEVAISALSAWPVSLLDDGTQGTRLRRDRRRTRRRRSAVAPGTHRPLAGRANGVTPDIVSKPLMLPEASKAVEVAPVDEGLDWPEATPADKELMTADVDEGVGLAWPAELLADDGAGLGWPADLEADEELAPVDEGLLQKALVPAEEALVDELAPADGGLMLQEALAPAEEAPADESMGVGWPEEALADELTPVDEGLMLQEASKATEGIADLVAAWHRGESMASLARQLRACRPSLTLLEAIQSLKDAIHTVDVLPATQAVFVEPSPLPAPVLDSPLLGVLRDLAVQEPMLPAEQDALRRWQSGGRRAVAVREIAAAHQMSEVEARATYDRVILPRVVNDLNGSAETVLGFIQVAPDDQAEMPPAVLDCVARLLGLPKAHAGLARPMLRVLRETLAALDDERRA